MGREHMPAQGGVRRTIRPFRACLSRGAEQGSSGRRGALGSRCSLGMTILVGLVESAIDNLRLACRLRAASGIPNPKIYRGEK